MKKKFLITGFEAFAGDAINPTQLMLDWVDDEQFETQLLPVEFAHAHSQILNRSDLNDFEGILCFGLAAGRSKVSLERVGLNWNEATIADNGGNQPVKGPIDLNSEKVYFTKAPLEKLQQALAKENIPVEISLSAGGYVCNHLYFQLLKAEIKPWVVFIHVPYLQEQVANKNPKPAFFTRDQLQKTLKILVQSLRAD